MLLSINVKNSDSNAVCLGSHDKNTVWRAACLSPGVYTSITLMIFFTYKVVETHGLGQCSATNDIYTACP